MGAIFFCEQKTAYEIRLSLVGSGGPASSAVAALVGQSACCKSKIISRLAVGFRYDLVQVCQLRVGECAYVRRSIRRAIRLSARAGFAS